MGMVKDYISHIKSFSKSSDEDIKNLNDQLEKFLAEAKSTFESDEYEAILKKLQEKTDPQEKIDYVKSQLSYND